MLTLLIFCGLISAILSILGRIVSKKIESDSNKLSPFECGFEPGVIRRFHFSSHFFLVSLVFVVFDVELVLLFPVVILSPSGEGNGQILMIQRIILGLSVGFLYE